MKTILAVDAEAWVLRTHQRKGESGQNATLARLTGAGNFLSLDWTRLYSFPDPHWVFE